MGPKFQGLTQSRTEHSDCSLKYKRLSVLRIDITFGHPIVSAASPCINKNIDDVEDPEVSVWMEPSCTGTHARAHLNSLRHVGLLGNVDPEGDWRTGETFIGQADPQASHKPGWNYVGKVLCT